MSFSELSPDFELAAHRADIERAEKNDRNRRAFRDFVIDILKRYDRQLSEDEDSPACAVEFRSGRVRLQFGEDENCLPYAQVVDDNQALQTGYANQTDEKGRAFIEVSLSYLRGTLHQRRPIEETDLQQLREIVNSIEAKKAA